MYGIIDCTYLMSLILSIVSYDNSKVCMRWSEAGVTVNPELKLLQYNFKQPLEMEEIHTYMAEKGGNYI